MQALLSEFWSFGIDEPNLCTQNDFGFAIVSADVLDLEQNSKKCSSVVELFIQSVRTNKGITLRDASCAFSCFLTLDEANLRTQNDFGFAIVSAEDLDLEQNSKKCPSVVELFIQSVVTNNRITLRDASSAFRILIFWNSMGRIYVPRTTLDLLLSPRRISIWNRIQKNALRS